MKYKLTWAVIHANDLKNEGKAKSVIDLVGNAINRLVWNYTGLCFKNSDEAYSLAMDQLGAEASGRHMHKFKLTILLLTGEVNPEVIDGYINLVSKGCKPTKPIEFWEQRVRKYA